MASRSGDQRFSPSPAPTRHSNATARAAFCATSSISWRERSSCSTRLRSVMSVIAAYHLRSSPVARASTTRSDDPTLSCRRGVLPLPPPPPPPPPPSPPLFTRISSSSRSVCSRMARCSVDDPQPPPPLPPPSSDHRDGRGAGQEVVAAFERRVERETAPFLSVLRGVELVRPDDPLDMPILCGIHRARVSFLRLASASIDCARSIAMLARWVSCSILLLCPGVGLAGSLG